MAKSNDDQGAWNPIDNPSDPVPAPPPPHQDFEPCAGERHRKKVEGEDAIELAELIAAIDGARDAETAVEFDDPQQWKKRHE